MVIAEQPRRFIAPNPYFVTLENPESPINDPEIIGIEFLGAQMKLDWEGSPNVSTEASGRPLSPRLRQVLALSACGATEEQVATRLGISKKTVHSQRLDGRKRTAAHNVAHILHRLRQTGRLEVLNGIKQQQKVQLSSRQWEVFKLIAQGMNESAIAKALYVGVTTVRTHRNNAAAKFMKPDAYDASVQAAFAVLCRVDPVEVQIYRLRDKQVAISDVHRLYAKQIFGVDSEPGALFDDTNHMLFGEGTETYCAYTTGRYPQLKGAITLVKHPSSARHSVINYLAVDETWERRGLGRMLICQAADAARQVGGEALRVLCLGPAQNYYTNEGFRPVSGSMYLEKQNNL
ncbi:GNAT family N-acetyltransferase [Candidatus Saccharibacteria bacterium]|nr:GNAT family N-acetyltransferase [Candidatus Saccharibacteria bacterium]